MSTTLTNTQYQALSLTENGKKTIVVDVRQPFGGDPHMKELVLELPRLVQLGLMSREQVNDHVYIYRVRPSGERVANAYFGEDPDYSDGERR